MTLGTMHDLLPFIRKLENIYPLTAGDRHAVANLPMQVRDVRAEQDLVREMDRPSQCCLLLDGFAYRSKIVEEGRRQILSFHIAGDMADLLSLHLGVMDYNLTTLAPSKVAFISHQSIHALIRSCPRIGVALWRDTLIDAAFFRQWMIGLGCRSAYAGIAHLLCELVHRMQIAGLIDGFSVKLPITQGIVADAAGVTQVHVNRILRALRGDGLIHWEGKVLTVLDWDGLQQAGQFDPTYLHYAQDQAA